MRYQNRDLDTSVAANEFTRRRGKGEEATLHQPLTDEETLALRVACEDALGMLGRQVHDYGANEYGKALRAVLTKMGA